LALALAISLSFIFCFNTPSLFYAEAQFLNPYSNLPLFSVKLVKIYISLK